MNRFLIMSVAVAVAVLAALGVARATDDSSRASTSAAFFCVFSKTVTVAGHSVSTPTICIPSP